MEEVILIILTGLAQLDSLAPPGDLTPLEQNFAILSSLIGSCSQPIAASDTPLAPIPSGRGDASSRDHSVILTSVDSNSIRVDFGPKGPYNIAGSLSQSESVAEEWMDDSVPGFRGTKAHRDFGKTQARFNSPD